MTSLSLSNYSPVQPNIYIYLLKVTYLSGLTATVTDLPKGEAVAKEVKAPSLTAISMKIRSNQITSFKREGIYVHIHIAGSFIVQQKLTQHCKASIFQ